MVKKKKSIKQRVSCDKKYKISKINEQSFTVTFAELFIYSYQSLFKVL